MFMCSVVHLLLWTQSNRIPHIRPPIHENSQMATEMLRQTGAKCLLYSMCFILYNMYHILHTVYCGLHTIYHILPTTYHIHILYATYYTLYTFYYLLNTTLFTSICIYVIYVYTVYTVFGTRSQGATTDPSPRIAAKEPAEAPICRTSSSLPLSEAAPSLP